MPEYNIGYKITGTPICVDYWNAADCDQPSDRFYFLTHAHDHSMFCLTTIWRFPIYCSSTTAKLTSSLKQLPSTSFIPIDIGDTLSIDCGRIRGFEDKSFCVTALEANHCPGSAIFLFEGWFGRILATGGFRFENEELDYRLREAPIDHLYLDITNWNRDKEASIVIPIWMRSLVNALTILARRPPHETVLLVTPEASVGQERLLVGIAENYEDRIRVTEHRVKLLKELGIDGHFTADLERTRFRLINGTKSQIIRTFKEELQASKSVCIIVFTTPTMAKEWEDILTATDLENYELRRSVHVVPYSDHSTTDELEAFLRRLTIRRLHFTGRNLDQAAADQLRQSFEITADTSVTIKTRDVSGRDTTSNEPVASKSAFERAASDIIDGLLSPDYDGRRVARVVKANMEDSKEQSRLQQSEERTIIDDRQHDSEIEEIDSIIDQRGFLINKGNNVKFTENELDAILKMRHFD